MKKLLFFLVFSITLSLATQAGYVIRGINHNVDPSSLKNYTLAIDGAGTPQAAASMYTSHGISMGKNTIAIVPSYYSPFTVPVPCFPVFPNLAEDFDIEVRDFYYILSNNTYVLCGARITENYSHAFVAKIDLNALPPSMDYNEYPEAEIFYSICVPNNLSLGYFVCGKVNNHGVIASVDSNLQFTNFVTTEDEYEWEYHKIIAHPATEFMPKLIVSGRNPACTQIGFTTIDWQLNTSNSYYWDELSEPDAHCVVCNHSTESDKIVLASSHGATATLFPVILSSSTPQISAYHYSFIGTEETKYCVQDIGMYEINDVFDPAVSVAGYIAEGSSLLSHQAWYGVTYFISAAPMNNTNYSLIYNGQYEHYKIRYDQNANLYTGGYFESGFTSQQCALFGTPGTVANCDDPDNSSDQFIDTIILYNSFNLTTPSIISHDIEPFGGNFISMPEYGECLPFKGGGTPELAPAIEDESEMITFYDRITVKDTPENTSYQIYNVMGQLIQAGTTNPDISTAQLSKGLYILRLENGKVYKFVK